MAGQPRRRQRREALREADRNAELLAPQRPGKPVEEMTAAEQEEYVKALRRYLRELARPSREAGVRAGRVRPRNRAEVELFASDLLPRRTGDDEAPDA